MISFTSIQNNKPFNDIHTYNSSVKNNEPVNGKKTDRKKVYIAAGTFAALAGVFVAGRKGLLGNKVKNILKPEKVAEKIEKSAASAIEKDNLSYKVKAPNIEGLKHDLSYIDPDFPLEAEYSKIKQDILRDSGAARRYNEVCEILSDTADGTGVKLKKAGISAAYRFDERAMERSITQKRYFSLPGNKAEGYCGLDPLLYKNAREEINDTYFGYYILDELNMNDTSEKLNLLRSKFGDKISASDNEFLDKCIEKLLPEDALCCGRNSVLHAHELARTGKIFRDAMGIPVK